MSIEKPERVCLFQKLEETKTMLGKVTGYEIKCELTVRSASQFQIWLLHFRSTDYMDCDPKKCPILQTYSILTSDSRIKEETQ